MDVIQEVVIVLDFVTTSIDTSVEVFHNNTRIVYIISGVFTSSQRFCVRISWHQISPRAECVVVNVSIFVNILNKMYTTYGLPREE